MNGPSGLRSLTASPRVIVRIEGPAAAEALASALAAGVSVLRALGRSGALEVEISPAGLSTLRRAARNHRAKVRVLSRSGLPYAQFAALRRPGIFVGAFLYFAALVLTQTVIWAVRVEGAPKALGDVVAQKAHALGAVPGALRFRVDPDRLARALVEAIPAITWAGVSMEGGLLTVTVAPRLLPQQRVPAGLDLVAARAGTVVRTVLEHGTLLVEPGTPVAAGQMLVLGSVEPGPTERGGVPGPVRREPAAAQVYVQFPFSKAIRVSRRQATRVTRGPWQVAASAATAGRVGSVGQLPPAKREIERQAYGGPVSLFGRPLGRVEVVRWRLVTRQRVYWPADTAIAMAKRKLALELLRNFGRGATVMRLEERNAVTMGYVDVSARGEAMADVAVPGGRGTTGEEGRQ